jgi:hypothetical protein
LINSECIALTPKNSEDDGSNIDKSLDPPWECQEGEIRWQVAKLCVAVAPP